MRAVDATRWSPFDSSTAGLSSSPANGLLAVTVPAITSGNRTPLELSSTAVPPALTSIILTHNSRVVAIGENAQRLWA